MNTPPRLYSFTSKLLIIGIIVVFILIIAIVTISSSVEATAAEQKQARNNSYSSSPNVLTAAFYRLSTGLTLFIESAGNKMLLATSEAASLTVDSSKCFVAGGNMVISRSSKLIGSAAVSTEGVVTEGVALIARSPVNALDAVSGSEFIKNVTIPEEDFEVPIIDPNSPELKAALAALPPEPLVDGNLSTEDNPSWPIAGDITTHFGVPHWLFQATHSGIDISDGKASGITKVRPFRPGVIIETNYSQYGLGNHVVVDHGSGVTSVYAHLATIEVGSGQKVSQDSVLGTEGTTGLSTGPHVHFEIRVNGQATDPLQFIQHRP